MPVTIVREKRPVAQPTTKPPKETSENLCFQQALRFFVGKGENFPKREMTGSPGIRKKSLDRPAGYSHVYTQSGIMQVRVIFQLQIKAKNTKPAQALSIQLSTLTLIQRQPKNLDVLAPHQ